MKSKLDIVRAANPTLEIQLYLRDISESYPDIPRVIPSGIYDSHTQKAVMEFQKKFNLPITGTVDFTTWNAIVKEYRSCIHCTKSPSSVTCFPSKMQEYKKGDKGNMIIILQTILKSYKKYYKNYNDIELTGEFDDQTEEAIKNFQKLSGIPVTGVLDRKTWNTLNTINKTCHLYD